MVGFNTDKHEDRSLLPAIMNPPKRKIRTYIFHSDPSHGWMAVKRAELVRLGIDGQISSCSYQNGGTVYLEEDCDAALFLAAKKTKGEEVTKDQIQESHTDQNHRIRGYTPYQSAAEIIADGCQRFTSYLNQRNRRAT